MALGRAEKIFKEIGVPVAICNSGGYPRKHDSWLGNPAVDENSKKKIIDGASARPYIKSWNGRRIIYDESYRPHAGKIWLTHIERNFARERVGDQRFAVVAPFIKDNASANKDWGVKNWEAAIAGLPIPVYQLLPDLETPVIKGAIGIHTKTFRQAAAIIDRAAVVMCNEGGTHHMAASMGVPAVVIFGAFISPKTTGYDFHRNISVETQEGFCGNFDPCKHCKNALAQITPEMVRSHVDDLLRIRT